MGASREREEALGPFRRKAGPGKVGLGQEDEGSVGHSSQGHSGTGGKSSTAPSRWPRPRQMGRGWGGATQEPVSAEPRGGLLVPAPG